MWTQLISGFLQLVLLILSKWFESDAEKKKIKAEAIKDVTEGLQERDPSKITAGFEKVKNL